MKRKLYYLFILLLMISVISACSTEVKTEEKKVLLSQVQLFKDSDLYSDVEVYEITYLSDGLKVNGYIVKPKVIAAKAPVLIYNRGGNREYGSIDEKTLQNWIIPWARKGYVILASQYRGNAGGEGKEEFGGSDVNDVLNLQIIAEELSYADSKNIVMLGYSRGGMMTYLAIKHGFDLKAAAVVGGVADLFESYNSREDMKFNVLEPLVGNPIKDKEEYIERSAVYWVDKLDVPILILHGEADDKVSLKQAEDIATKLKEHKKEYKYISYPNGNHSLNTHEMLVDEEISQWFKSHLQ